MRDYLIEHCDTYGFKPEHRDALVDLYDRIFADGTARAEFLKAHDILLEGGPGRYPVLRPHLAETEKVTGAHYFTTDLLLFICGGPALREKYKKLGIDEKIWFDTMSDMVCKYRECFDVYGIVGVFTESWHCRFFWPDRFQLGRMQYEPCTWDRDEEFHGVRRGDPAVTVHIPSNLEPFDRAARMDSYKRAYYFFCDRYRDLFPDGKMIICTHSWLLLEDHRKFLKGCPNILDFMDDFEVIVSNYSESGGDLWRIFNTMSKNVDDFPTDTALRKSYVDHLKAGGLPGGGYGAFFIDGPGFFEK